MNEITKTTGYLPNFRNKADGMNLLTSLPEQSIKTDRSQRSETSAEQ